eukprot:CAMPEP_0202059040 /NCGR_PEP_ID=MMETSP0963-20130614/33949_1 /ASSEMBLY_ACC=CAM_ASM_000494 /TAXON_ID=4773 /ORGANISM="Schizochytrium aggregatum, Strain ATCC28209" /LENGTH=69 /DNA_ID=CAMNT_0048625057 /DNA_START=145 /DNA_END=354 /DNA_ORIENTATION=+
MEAPAPPTSLRGSQVSQGTSLAREESSTRANATAFAAALSRAIDSDSRNAEAGVHVGTRGVHTYVALHG